MASRIRRFAAHGRGPVWRSTLAALALVGLLSAALPGSVLGLNCASGPQPRYFMGTIEDHSTTKGGEAKIAYVNETLCSPLPSGTGTFSSYWVALVNYEVDPIDEFGRNIYQIGIDECKGTACVAGAPSNTPYYFWAYGRNTSLSCGPLVDPEPVVIPGTPSGLKLYTIVLVTAGEDHYDAKIDGSIKNTKAADSLDVCWHGVDGVQILNESFNNGTQAGGPNSNYQDFQNPRWFNGSTWQTISRAAGTTCDDPPSASRGCKWSTITPNTWRSWDTRF